MSDTPKRKFGGAQPNAGRKTKAEELGLAALIDKAWPIEEQEKAIRHIASLIGPEFVIKTDKYGREQIELTIAAKDQLAALRLLLEYKFGKPAQVVEHQGRVDIGKPVAEMTDEELRRLLGDG